MHILSGWTHTSNITASVTIEKLRGIFATHGLPYTVVPDRWSTKGLSPVEMLMGRKPRSHLDLLHPDVGARREEKKSRKGGETKSFFKPGDWVFNKDFSQGPPWLPGVICRQTGPVSFMVDLWDSRQIRRHQGHLRVCHRAGEERGR